jgi:hypothetical protein
LVERWNGREWSIQRAPTPVGAKRARLASVSCVSAGFCVAVGSWTDQAGRGLALAERWNGRGWSIQQMPPAPGLTSVSCASRTACIAVGSGGAFAERWDGTGWSIQRARPDGLPGEPSDTGFRGVSCSSASACTAVGAWRCTVTDCQDGGPVTEYWNGRAWSLHKTLQFPPVADLGAVSCPRANACIAVGDGGDGYTAALAERVSSAG